MDLACCPERIAQGKALVELEQLPQLIGGVTPRAAERARRLAHARSVWRATASRPLTCRTLPAVSTKPEISTASSAQHAAAAIESRDPISAARLVQVDNEVNALRHQIFQILFSEDWSHGVEPAVNAALIGRYYERFADHAVAIARKVTACSAARNMPARHHV